MRLTSIRVLAPVLVMALAGVSAAGCNIDGESGDADKAGGSDAPSVLRLAVADDADQPDARFARDFAARVARLSDGALRVRIVWDAAGQDSPDYERRIAELVRGGRFELGWMGARAWDRMGVTGFQALQAPFLVTDYELLGGIVTGPVGARMLAGLDRHGFVGLALVPERIRYIFGVRRAARVARRLRRRACARAPLACDGRADPGTWRDAGPHQRRRRRGCRRRAGRSTAPRPRLARTRRMRARPS